MSKKRLTTWVGSVAVVGIVVGAGVFVGTASSSEAFQRGMHGRTWRGAPGAFGPGGAAPFGRFFRELDLTEEQREAIHEALASERETHRDLRQRLFEARKLLHEAALREEPESVLNQLAQAVGRVEAEAAFSEARRFAGVVAILEPEQKSKLEELYAEAESRRQERQERFREGLRRRQEQ